MGNSSYRATLMGKRVAELYLDPYTAYHIITCLDRTAVKKTQHFSFLQMLCHTLEMRPLLPARTADMEMIEDALVEYDDALIDLEPTMYDFEYDEFLGSVKTALFMHDWIHEREEEFLLERYKIRPGEIRAKLDIADWLVYASEEIARIKKQHKLIAEIRKLRVRLKYGVKEELLPLLKLKNIGRVRARALFRNSIKTIGDISKADIVKLSQILGKKIAEDVKKQLGQEEKPVKENKRKGQKSVRDYSI